MTDPITSWLQECDTSPFPLENPHFPSTPPLLSTSVPSTITLGTGASIISSLCDEILTICTTELLFTTCFWTSSTSLTCLRTLLLALSDKALTLGTKIRVRIGFSSLSVLQKLFHTRSPTGRHWKPHEWQSKLGLPGPEELRGLDLKVKSLFVLPFCVMHPKFVIVDGRVAWLLSCNVSWERWFEGAVRVEGEVVGSGFVRFWMRVWGVRDEDGNAGLDERDLDLDLEAGTGAGSDVVSSAGMSLPTTPSANGSTTDLPIQFLAHPSSRKIPTLFLPSEYHQNPHFRPFPWQAAPAPPRTPLNSFLLHLFNTAKTSIYLQTPNLTSPPVLEALVSALGRGVSIEIITNQRLMLLEQLVTAGTTTSHCVQKLITRYEHTKQQHHETQTLYQSEDNASVLGRLQICYFEGEAGVDELQELMPVSSHLKMTVVDGEVLVLGSGNMDRASWYTSQELGVAFADGDMARAMLERVERVNQRRCRVVYDG